MLYAYGRIVVNAKRWWHPVLFLISAILLIYTVIIGTQFFFFFTDVEKNAYISGICIGNYPTLFLISKVVMTGLHFLYLLTSFIRIYRISRNYNNTSTPERQKINYLLWFMGLNLAFILFYFSSFTFLSIQKINFYVFPIFGIFLFVFVYYMMVQYPYILSEKNEVIGGSSFHFFQPHEATLASGEDITETQRKNVIPDEQLMEMYEDILDYMEKEKPYLNPELSLNLLSESLQLGAHKLSLTINQKSGMNFFNFINSYRIAEAQKLLSAAGNHGYSIEDIAFMSGFNSRAAFYATFKKQLELTPKAYLAKQKEEGQ